MKNCKTNRRRSVIEPSPCGKNYFLQNKPSAASRHAEPMRDAGWCAGVRPAAQLRLTSGASKAGDNPSATHKEDVSIEELERGGAALATSEEAK